jgi:rubrerythrin
MTEVEVGRMNVFNSVEELLDFAISEEEKAAAFYSALAAKQKSDAMRKVFEGFSVEENGHKNKLLAIKERKYWTAPAGQVIDLHIADYTIDVEPSANMDLQEALLLAMKKEKGAFRLYSDLAEMVEDEDIKRTMLLLAQEEAKHKLRFEVEYDESILNEN